VFGRKFRQFCHAHWLIGPLAGIAMANNCRSADIGFAPICSIILLFPFSGKQNLFRQSFLIS
jgi:hypothetical protein